MVPERLPHTLKAGDEGPDQRFRPTHEGPADFPLSNREPDNGDPQAQGQGRAHPTRSGTAGSTVPRLFEPLDNEV